MISAGRLFVLFGPQFILFGLIRLALCLPSVFELSS
jgi:hypothetical protein